MKFPKEHITSSYTSSLAISVKEGMAASIMIGITDYYIIPLALFLKLNVKEIALLVSLPHLLAAFFQFFSLYCIRKFGNRKNFLLTGTLFQAGILLFVACLPHCIHLIPPITLVVLVILFRVCGNLIGTIWSSLMSDYLKSEERGIYFGWRSKWIGLSQIGAVIIAGLLLTLFDKINLHWGFTLLFFAAFICRLISTKLMTYMEDVPFKPKAEEHFTFFQFLKRFRESNFVKYVFYVSSITFATHIASPFFSVYMLRDLNLPYYMYMAIHLSAVLAGILSFTWWGKHADIVGNASVLKTTSLFIPVIPLLWIAFKNPFILVCTEFFSGFIWGGFNLCALNFIYDAVTPSKRVRCLSYFNFINSMAVFLGATLGGYLADHLPVFYDSPLIIVFLISSVLRFFSHFVLSGKFTEVRSHIHSVSNKDLFFSVVGIRPILGRNRDILTLSPDPE